MTNKLRAAYARASKTDRGRILDEVVATTGMGRSTARRMLTGPPLPDPDEQVDRRQLRAKTYSDDSRLLLEHVWALMGTPCGKYFVVMAPVWLPLLAENGDLDKPFATPTAIDEVTTMSAATIDRYLTPARQAMTLRGIPSTVPTRVLQGSIGLSTSSDEPPTTPGVIEADTVAHCGPTLAGEFARTLTMTDRATGWTENISIRNNAATWITTGVEALTEKFPFPILSFDSDNGSEFINHHLATWLQKRDIAQTRSRPYQKNDQATVESKNHHVVRKHAFHWRYDTQTELALLNDLWERVCLRLNFFTPTRKPIGYTITHTGKRRRVYDPPQTPWMRVQATGLLTPAQIDHISARIQAINPADLTRQITEIQHQLTELARHKTQALTAAQALDMTSLTPSIQRLQATK